MKTLIVLSCHGNAGLRLVSDESFLLVQIRSERELDKLKGLRLAELWLEGNPLCQHFKDQTIYIRLVQHECP